MAGGGFDFKKGLKHFEAFAVNINEFDRLTRTEKAVFYFEDFINDDPATLSFLAFFQIDVSARKYNFAEMKETSRAWYRGHHGVLDPHNRPQLKPRERVAIGRMLQRKLGQNFERYLGRYSFDD